MAFRIDRILSPARRPQAQLFLLSRHASGGHPKPKDCLPRSGAPPPSRALPAARVDTRFDLRAAVVGAAGRLLLQSEAGKVGSARPRRRPSHTPAAGASRSRPPAGLL